MDKVLKVGKESSQNFYKTELRSINRGSLGKAVAKLSKTKKKRTLQLVGDVEVLKKSFGMFQKILLRLVSKPMHILLSC
ncbi:hypothetical protein Q3G72_012994 [Acer saccharum]|nr:hypothetical protein Q3G72_012994 [Acer saccharum]